MHRALLIAEVQHRIFQDCDKPSLASIASVCRQLHGIALELLWVEVTSFKQILDCFPSHIWDVQPTLNNEPPAWFLQEYLCPDHLERYQFYAPKIKRLTIDNSNPTVDASFFTALAFLLNDRPLFPNLAKLIWKSTSVPLAQLCSPTLKHLEVMLPNEFLYKSILNGLTLRCPTLHVLHVNFAGGAVQLSPSVQQWDSLKKLYFVGLKWSAIRHLARLPKLSVLHLTDLFIDDTLTQPFRGFPALMELQCDCVARGLLVLLDAVSSKLRKLMLSVLGHPAVGDWHNIFNSVARNEWSQSLQVVFLMQRSARPTDSCVDFGIISALLPIAQLRRLKIVAAFLKIRDEDCWKIAQSWPKLQYLSLKSIKSTPPQGTFDSLRAFATHCPSLRTLSLAFDARINNLVETENPYSATTLQNLEAEGSPIQNPALVAATLVDMFPQLAAATKGQNADWVGVNNLLAPMAAVRAQEHGRRQSLQMSMSF
ncbi:hypothetical protein BDN72DRAFT_953999 [Pluteus cervinus]|uniref:Uncharacterized protein n=1 Tax=Pluteus cervinus TaxID=181527 RepID=A0ACD3BEX3_9AGAR|nr:hypothetical protein BDN72DRAFT_953999 [Pluteus cervinus]